MSLSGEQGGGPEKQAQPIDFSVYPQKRVLLADSLQADPSPTGGPHDS